MSKDGLCVIVTGSASGLGAATAAILAKDGARIVVNYSSSQKEAEQTGEGQALHPHPRDGSADRRPGATRTTHNDGESRSAQQASDHHR